MLAIALLASGCGGGRKDADETGASAPATYEPAAVVGEGWGVQPARAWTLPVGDDSRIIGNGDQMIVTDYGRGSSSGATKITAYDVAGKEPAEQWSADIVRREIASDYEADPVYWGPWVIIDDNLFNAADGERRDRPWSPSSKWSIAGDVVVACGSDGFCSGWDYKDVSKPLWEAQIKGVEVNVGHGAQEAVNDANQFKISDDTILDARTGGTFSVSLGSGYAVLLSDGWVVVDRDAGTYEVYETSGRSARTSAYPEGDLSDRGPVDTIDHPLRSASEWESWQINGDVSWAAATYGYGGCAVMLKHSSFDAKSPYSGCSPDTVTHDTLIVSSDEAVAVLADSSGLRRTSTGYPIDGMWAVASGAYVDFVDNGGEEEMNSNEGAYLINSSLVVTCLDGKVTAYTP